jgi:hypothetical protein
MSTERKKGFWYHAWTHLMSGFLVVFALIMAEEMPSGSFWFGYVGGVLVFILCFWRATR